MAGSPWTCPQCGAPYPGATPVTSDPVGTTEPVATTSAVAVPPWEIVVMSSAAVMLIGSFLDFYSASDSGHSFGWSAWSNSLSLFPAITVSALGIVAVGVVVALTRFVPGFRLPDQIVRDWPNSGKMIAIGWCTSLPTHLLSDPEARSLRRRGRAIARGPGRRRPTERHVRTLSDRGR